MLETYKEKVLNDRTERMIKINNKKNDSRRS